MRRNIPHQWRAQPEDWVLCLHCMELPFDEDRGTPRGVDERTNSFNPHNGDPRKPIVIENRTPIVIRSFSYEYRGTFCEVPSKMPPIAAELFKPASAVKHDDDVVIIKVANGYILVY